MEADVAKETHQKNEIATLKLAQVFFKELIFTFFAEV